MDAPEEGAGQDDVGVDVAEEIEAGAFGRPREDVVEEGRAVLAAADLRDVPHPQLAGDGLRPRLLADEDDLTPGLQTQPTADGVALDDAYVAHERLGYCEDGEHRAKVLPFRGQRRIAWGV